MQWNEEYIYENDLAGNSFLNILRAGTTFPDTQYDIRRIPYKNYAYVLEYVVSGSGYIEYDNRVYNVKAGDCYFLRNDCYCHYFSEKKDPYQKTWILFNGEFIDFLVNKFNIDKIIIKQIDTARENIQRIHTILSEIGSNSLLLTDEVAILIFSLLSKLGNYGTYTLTSNLTQAQKIKRYLDNNIYRKITLKDICGIIFLSEVQVIRIFKNEFNCTPMQYIKDKRLEYSKQILVNTNIRIQQVAEMFNFADGQCYAKQFKSYTRLHLQNTEETVRSFDITSKYERREGGVDKKLDKCRL